MVSKLRCISAAQRQYDICQVQWTWWSACEQVSAYVGSKKRAAEDANGAPRTETKATTVYPVQELLSVMPSFLHGSVRASKYYTARTDALTFQAQTHRSRTANVDENRRKLMDEVTRMYQEKTPAETSAEKKSKYQEVYEGPLLLLPLGTG